MIVFVYRYLVVRVVCVPFVASPGLQSKQGPIRAGSDGDRHGEVHLVRKDRV